jgi:hypothetical protein
LVKDKEIELLYLWYGKHICGKSWSRILAIGLLFGVE